jgi:hypothetical protein
LERRWTAILNSLGEGTPLPGVSTDSTVGRVRFGQSTDANGVASPYFAKYDIDA